MKTAMVAATGGHLAQLHALRRRVAPDSEFVWITFDTPQSRSLLRGEVVEFVPVVQPRAVGRVLTNSFRASAIFKRHGVSAVVSTGSGVALSFLPVARALGLPCTYIESAARSQGPSLTGRLLARCPGVQLRTQYRAWASDRWQLGPSVFDAFTPEARLTPVPEVRRIVVTLGTIPNFSFRALVERVLLVAPAACDITWQTGATNVQGLGITSAATLPHEELQAAMTAADVVIAHAGVGSALAALQAGKVPVLVPRRAGRREHVDDHQTQIAAELGGRGLAVPVEVDRLSRTHLAETLQTRILECDAG